MPIWSNLSFQNANSILIEHLIFFHDHRIVILISVTIISSYLIFTSLICDKFNRFFQENHEIELFWTSIPTFILIFIALPSLKILYIIDELPNPALTIKAIGHQWYWSYEYRDMSDLEIDSFIEQNTNIRLLRTSNKLIIPFLSPIRIITSSSDVIHSWTIPSLGIKADAIPGRLNQLNLFIKRPGILTGQCSEICGSNHSFIPILISSISPYQFVNSFYRV